jgi:MFS family permease
VRRLLALTSAVVFFDSLFFSALTPLLPHYAHALGLGKTGAGVLSGAYAAGTFFGAIPSGVVAARAGVKPTVLVGLVSVGLCTVLFGLGTQAWELDTARFVQGFASAFTWTGALAWLVAGTPAARRGAVIGGAFAMAVAGALFGPVLGAVASVAGIGWTFGVVGVLSLGLGVWAAGMPAERPDEPQPLAALARAMTDDRVLLSAWFVTLPALLFGALYVLAPLRLSALGYGSLAIGAVFLCTAAVEAGNNVLLGQLSDRIGTGPLLQGGLVASIVLAVLLPWPDAALLLAVLVVCSGVSFGSFFTPGMTELSHVSEERGLTYGYTFALVTLAWAPGQVIGAVGGAGLAHATSDTVAYLCLAGICALTLAALWRRGSIASTTRSAPGSSVSSSRTTAGG